MGHCGNECLRIFEFSSVDSDVAYPVGFQVISTGTRSRLRLDQRTDWVDLSRTALFLPKSQMHRFGINTHVAAHTMNIRFTASSDAPYGSGKNLGVGSTTVACNKRQPEGPSRVRYPSSTKAFSSGDAGHRTPPFIHDKKLFAASNSGCSPHLFDVVKHGAATAPTSPPSSLSGC